MLGHRARTFRVADHHYALVSVRGLEPGRTYRYSVTLDGAAVWPEPDARFAPSVIRTLDPAEPLTVVFGSCRASVPHDPPFTLSPDDHPEGRGLDALRALAFTLQRSAQETWPQVLLLIGDQVYADEVSPLTRAFMRARRDTSKAPGEEIADFEEYAKLYQEAWQEPAVRWLLSTVATTMLWDDHDVHDDWNISQRWVEGRRARPWWRERLIGAYMSYWLYQHLGNLSGGELATDELFAAVMAADDAGPALRAFAERAAASPDATRWTVCRDFGRRRLLAIDCRAGRVLTPGARSMLDEAAWRWVEERTTGEFDHLLIALADPYLLAHGIHHLEAWSEAVCDGAWGSAPVRYAERLREALDFDHWAAFRRAFDRLTELLRAVAAGERGPAPASIVALSGDVHHCYLAEAAFPSAVRSPVYQAVCSPIRNPLGGWERRALRLATSRAAGGIARALAATAGVPAPPITWRFRDGPSFANQIGALELHGREALLRVQRPVERDGVLGLETAFERRLA